METTVAITQPLERGGKRQKRTKVTAAEKQVVQWSYEATRLDLIRRTERAFAAVLAAQQRVTLTQNQADLAERLWQTVNKRVDAGKDPPSEASKAQIELSKVRMQHQQAVSELTDARYHLAALWESSVPRFERADPLKSNVPSRLPTQRRQIDDAAVGLSEAVKQAAGWFKERTCESDEALIVVATVALIVVRDEERAFRLT